MHADVLKVYIGYDPVETVAWHVMVQSILNKSSAPIAIVPLSLKNLSEIYTRPRDEKQSNEFSYSRFLVPFLSDFKGSSAYFDCDMLLRDDISHLFHEINISEFAVAVVKHDYIPRNKIKYLDHKQYTYPRKNWSSVILWNCGHPSNRVLTPELINTVEPSFLHRFSWLRDEEIGELDLRWNWLVGEYDNPPADVKNVHWTIGGPYFDEYKDSDFSEEWFRERYLLNYCKQRGTKARENP